MYAATETDLEKGNKMLPTEQQVTPLEQSRELYDQGFLLDTQWCWHRKDNLWLLKRGKHPYWEMGVDTYSAPTVAELAILLPWMVNKSSIYTLMIWRCGAGWGVDYFNDLNRPLINSWAGENLAKTMGDRVIWLTKEKILKPEEIKL